MKSKFVIISIFFLVLIGSVFAQTYEESYSVSYEMSGLQVESIKYEPYPVNPGEYFDLWVSVKNTGQTLNNVKFELVSTYPFSLDPNEEAVRSFSQLTTDSVLLKYKIRVDENAVTGVNELELNYQTSFGRITKTFDIYVSDAQTSFDGVIQDIEDNTISLALANTGKNVAESVIVKIPQQENFKAVGTSGQMVGNLENGDYTIVSFEVTQTSRGTDSNIIFQIDYTDNISVRRSVYLELPLDLSQKVSMSTDTLPTDFKKGASPQNQNSTSSKNWIWYLVVGVVLVLLFVFRKKILSIFRKKE